MTSTPDFPTPDWQRSLQAIMAEVMRPTQDQISKTIEEATRPLRESMAISLSPNYFAGIQNSLMPALEEFQRGLTASLARVGPISVPAVNLEALVTQARDITEDVEDLTESTDIATTEPDRQKSIAIIRQRIDQVLRQIATAERRFRGRVEAGLEVAGTYKEALEMLEFLATKLVTIYVLLDLLIK